VRRVIKREAKERAAATPPGDKTSDAEAFARATADVVRLGADPRGRVRAAPRIRLPLARIAPVEQTDQSDESFAAHGVDRRTIRKLKRGEYVVDDRCDLHRLTAVEAGGSVRRFLERSRRLEHRCVCIIHGRGLHSDGNVSILKSRVRALLASHPAVLAYADAPRRDGGTGAAYVLLRK
jgi:DNA-nicking Smr family endonuclease